MASTGLCVWTPTPQPVALLGEVVGPLRSLAQLAEVSHWGQALKVMFTSGAWPRVLLPSSPVWEGLPPHAPTMTHGSRLTARPFPVRRHYTPEPNELFSLWLTWARHWIAGIVTGGTVLILSVGISPCGFQPLSLVADLWGGRLSR